MRLVWATDVHLNFLSQAERRAFHARLRDSGDAVLITGDIAEAPSVRGLLLELHDAIEAPVYFVLGNHDYYHGAIARLRDDVRALCATHPRLVYLADRAPVLLGPRTALVGHDGWADGRAGDFFGSSVYLNDYDLIDDLVTSDPRERLTRMQRLADEAAHAMTAAARDALAVRDHVVVATHVPPFLAACWHEGRISDAEWSPHFTSVIAGQALDALMTEHGDRTMEVLCGHTHGEGTAQIRPNLLVRTGGAEYGAPRIARVLDVA